MDGWFAGSSVNKAKSTFNQVEVEAELGDIQCFDRQKICPRLAGNICKTDVGIIWGKYCFDTI